MKPMDPERERNAHRAGDQSGYMRPLVILRVIPK